MSEIPLRWRLKTLIRDCCDVLKEGLDDKQGGGYAVTSMSIRSVALSETCLGGSLENIKKE